jgi:hypothetical protein
MVSLGLMNKLVTAEYLGRFNRGYVKEFSNGSDVEYAIHPCRIAIMKEKSFVGDDPDEDPYNHLHSLLSYVGLLN